MPLYTAVPGQSDENVKHAWQEQRVVGIPTTDRPDTGKVARLRSVCHGAALSRQHVLCAVTLVLQFMRVPFHDGVSIGVDLRCLPPDNVLRLRCQEVPQQPS